MSRKNLFVFFAVVVCLFPSIIFCGITRVFDTQDDWNTCSLEHCDTLSIPGSVKILRIYDDEFSGDELNDFWTWEVGQYNGNDRGYYKIGNPTGIFSLITHPSPETPRPLTEWWGATDTAPKIYQQLDFNDDFEIETLVKGNSSSPNYEAYGLFLRHSSDNGVAAVYDNSQEGVKATAWKNASGEMSKNSIAFGSYPDEILFKLKKIDSTVEPYYKEAGGEWQLIDGYTINYDKAYFGIYHKHVSIRGSYGNFDYVRYYGHKTFTAGTIISPVIDLGESDPGTGKIRWSQNILYENARIKLYTRTSSNNIDWPGGWEGPYTNSEGNIIKSKPKRYLRFRAVLETDDYEKTPVLNSLVINYDKLDESESIIKDFKAYPTICSGNINIQYSLLRGAKKAEILVKDSTGRTKTTLEGEGTLGEKDISFNVAGFANGVYFVKINIEKNNGQKETEVTKFVVKK